MTRYWCRRCGKSVPTTVPGDDLTCCAHSMTTEHPRAWGDHERGKRRALMGDAERERQAAQRAALDAEADQ